MLQAQNLSKMRTEYEERYREKETEMLEVLRGYCLLVPQCRPARVPSTYRLSLFPRIA